SRAVGSSLHLMEVLDTITQQAIRLSGADACGIFELDAAGDRLQVLTALNLPEALVKGVEGRSANGSGAGEVGIGRAMGEGRALQIPDLETAEMADRDLYLNAGFRALLVVPMESPATWRAMAVCRSRSGRLDERTVELLSTVANQSRVAIDNARLF